MSATEKLLGKNSSGYGLESREYGRRHSSRWPRGILYPQKVGINFADKPEGRGFETRWGEILNLPNPWGLLSL
jgi:hypothetical protein